MRIGTTLSLLSVLSTFPSSVLVQAGDFWTVNCAPLTVQRSDPIVNPGVPASHVHAVSGGTAFSRSMQGIDSAVKARGTTCDKFTDHSNYVSLLQPQHRSERLELTI